MPAAIAWNSPEGKATVKHIVVNRIPSWKDGLHERQEEPVLLILDGTDVLLCTATGDGKSALFTVPILCHQEISQNPQDYPKFCVRKQPMGIVVTPTKGLANNIVDTLATHGISALAYDHATISRASTERRNLMREIMDCNLYRVILDDPGFRANLIFACLEEGHLAGEWGPTFREAFRGIGSFLRGRLPSNVPIFSISATLEPGAPTTALCKTLGFRANNFRLFRFSNERPDLQLVLEPLEHGRKVIVYGGTLEIVTQIYLYLLRMEPPGVQHGQRVRIYTALCEQEFNQETLSLLESDPKLQIIIATIALANGVHAPSLDNSISYTMPSTLSQTIQQAGRASRPPGATGRAVILVQKSDIRNAEKFQANLGSTSTDAPVVVPTSRKKRKAATEAMDPAKAELLIEKICLVAANNRRWQNPPLETTTLDCIEVNRPLPCSICCSRTDRTIEFPARASVHPPFLTPSAISSNANPELAIFKLTRNERDLVEERLAKFADDLFEAELYQPCNLHRPRSAFFPSSLQTRICDQVLRIFTLDALTTILDTAKWSFRETHATKLYNLIVMIQGDVTGARKPKRAPRTRTTRGRQGTSRKGKARADEWDSEQDSDEDVDGQPSDSDVDAEQSDSVPSPCPSPSPTRPPSLSPTRPPTPARPASKRPLENVTNQPTRVVRK
ncbi:P-loop containing nucleoside triphosphate hydrolase protein [Hymenopellis radicata]|nr:P-loop containing nucleoside triphosphate hydrolase protein [Hymenopellis radicata]